MLDFSTLYTKIPHNKLTTVLWKLVDFCFKGGAHQYLSVNKWSARWVADPDSYSVMYDETKIKLAIRYLMSNCCIFRFIDDLLTMNDGEFARSLEEIYPELELNKENEGTGSATFLDLTIETDGVKFATLCDKRNAFLFSRMPSECLFFRMPFLYSNIPSRMFYFSFGAERFSVQPEFLQPVKVSFHLLKPWLEECSGKVVNTFASRKYWAKFMLDILRPSAIFSVMFHSCFTF